MELWTSSHWQFAPNKLYYQWNQLWEAKQLEFPKIWNLQYSFSRYLGNCRAPKDSANSSRSQIFRQILKAGVAQIPTDFALCNPFCALWAVSQSTVLWSIKSLSIRLRPTLKLREKRCSAANGQQDRGVFFKRSWHRFFWGAAKKALQSWLTLSPIIMELENGLKGNYYWGDPFFTSMGIGGRVCLWKMATVQLLLAQPSSGLGFQSSQNDHQLVRRVCVYKCLILFIGLKMT